MYMAFKACKFNTKSYKVWPDKGLYSINFNHIFFSVIVISYLLHCIQISINLIE